MIRLNGRDSIYSHYRVCRTGLMEKISKMMRLRWILGFFFLCAPVLHAQDDDLEHNGAGYVPVVSGTIGYITTVSGGVPALQPHISPTLLVPMGHKIGLESRTDFTGFFQRKDLTHGPYSGKVFKSVESAQIDWLADSHVTVSAGKYFLPFGLYNERLSPFWIRNIQDSPITLPIGTSTSGAGDGFMLRGMATEHPSWSVQYTSYFSARSSINQLQAARTAGGDVSIYFPEKRVEVGTSYQRFLQGKEINSEAVYVSWQPHEVPVDLKAEYDQSYYGRGYWLESAYMLSQIPRGQRFFQHLQVAARIQQFDVINKGGISLPSVDTQKCDFEMNYYLRDDLHLVASYGRQFSSQGNTNIWNVGFMHRFLWPMWPGRKKS